MQLISVMHKLRDFESSIFFQSFTFQLDRMRVCVQHTVYTCARGTIKFQTLLRFQVHVGNQHFLDFSYIHAELRLLKKVYSSYSCTASYFSTLFTVALTNNNNDKIRDRMSSSCRVIVDMLQGNKFCISQECSRQSMHIQEKTHIGQLVL